MLSGKQIVLIISGGIAAYKSLDLIRRLKERGARVIPVMTKGAQEFITPLAAGALAAETVFTDLFDRQAEHGGKRRGNADQRASVGTRTGRRHDGPLGPRLLRTHCRPDAGVRGLD